MRFLLFLFPLLISLNLLAQQLPVHGPSEEQIEAMALHNQKVASSEALLGPVGARSTNVVPFHEWDKTGFIVMSDDDYYGVAEDMKKTIAENLPAETTLVVYTQSSSSSYQKDLYDYYSEFRPKDKVVVVEVPQSGSNDFWSRDNTPVPVWEDGKLSLVDAQYYYNFEPDDFFKNMFASSLQAHDYFYEGGNFMANSKGDCLVVNRKRSYPGGVSDTGAIPDELFETMYGCKTLLRFKHLKGIGHADEVVKFITDEIVLTDTEEYVEKLENAGFTVYLLPEPELNYETYVNSLIVNDTVFVPVFGESNDQKALDVYKNLNLGYKVIPVDSRELSTQGQGSIHCITMNYPPMPVQNLVQRLKHK